MNIADGNSSTSPVNLITPSPPPPPVKKPSLSSPSPPPAPEKKVKTKQRIVNLPTPNPPPAPVKKNKTKQRIFEKEETPIRHHRIVAKATDVTRFEELDDCFVLGFEPNDVKLAADTVAGSPEIAIVAEKGQVACRDYPHSRHLCVKFPFQTTPHDKYCELCYCYVCDTAAPCKLWISSTSNALLSHCDAYDRNGVWKRERKLRNLAAAFKHKQ